MEEANRLSQIFPHQHLAFLQPTILSQEQRSQEGFFKKARKPFFQLSMPFHSGARKIKPSQDRPKA